MTRVAVIVLLVLLVAYVVYLKFIKKDEDGLVALCKKKAKEEGYPPELCGVAAAAAEKTIETATNIGTAVVKGESSCEDRLKWLDKHPDQEKGFVGQAIRRECGSGKPVVAVKANGWNLASLEQSPSKISIGKQGATS